MNRFLRLSYRCCLVALGIFLVNTLQAQQPSPACSQCALWNAPQVPFHLYGNTYYVGTHGLGSLLIKTDAGLALIDGALPESAPMIASNLRTLGFRVEDVKLIFNTHVHYDHAGGIAALQRMSGAEVVVSQWSAGVLAKGGVSEGDPQYGVLEPVAAVKRVRSLHDGETVRLGEVLFTPHSTPGHTPGGTSWTWESCEAGRCLGMVYADSISPVSADGFKYTSSAKYPHAIEDFERSFTFLDSVHCDVLVTPHPEISGLWERVAARGRGVTPDPLVDPGACKALAAAGRENLRKRIASETGN